MLISQNSFLAPDRRAERVFAIGDTHGCYKTLRVLIQDLDLGPKDVVYLLGDYVDRGPRVRKLLDYVCKLQRAGVVVPLRGNHEQIMLDALRDPILHRRWRKSYGGDATLKSFNVAHVSSVPTEYLTWMRSLPHAAKSVCASGSYILSHAGVDLSAANPFDDTPTNRRYSLYNRDAHARHRVWRNVVGHSIKPVFTIHASVDSGSTIYLDGGCASGRYLVALELTTLSTTAVRRLD